MSNSQYKFDKAIIVRIDRMAVELQEHQGCFQTDSFVAIEERMVLDKMKEVRCRHLENVTVKELPAKTEITLTVELTPEERAFYEALRRKALESLQNRYSPGWSVHRRCCLVRVQLTH